MLGALRARKGARPTTFLVWRAGGGGPAGPRAPIRGWGARSVRRAGCAVWSSASKLLRGWHNERDTRAGPGCSGMGRFGTPGITSLFEGWKEEVGWGMHESARRRPAHGHRLSTRVTPRTYRPCICPGVYMVSTAPNPSPDTHHASAPEESFHRR